MPTDTTKSNSIYTSLMQAQKDMGPLLKNATNPAFRSKYADLSSVIETITEPLHKNGLVFLQTMNVTDYGPSLITKIVHVESGESIESLCPIVSKDPSDPQKFGGATTYARRYSLMALLGLAPEDDDGNEASKAANRPAQAQSKPAPVKSPDDPVCEIAGCHNTVYKSKEDLNRKYHDGHVVCFTHSTNGDWHSMPLKDDGPEEPTSYDIAKEQL